MKLKALLFVVAQSLAAQRATVLAGRLTLHPPDRHPLPPS